MPWWIKGKARTAVRGKPAVPGEYGDEGTYFFVGWSTGHCRPCRSRWVSSAGGGPGLSDCLDCSVLPDWHCDWALRTQRGLMGGSPFDTPFYESRLQERKRTRISHMVLFAMEGRNRPALKRAPSSYRRYPPRLYELCASFKRPPRGAGSVRPRHTFEPVTNRDSNAWVHAAAGAASRPI